MKDRTFIERELRLEDRTIQIASLGIPIGRASYHLTSNGLLNEIVHDYVYSYCKVDGSLDSNRCPTRLANNEKNPLICRFVKINCWLTSCRKRMESISA
jgi:hypothetical protein